MKRKSTMLAQLRRRIARITDRLGLSIDPRILDTVVALQFHGFPTDASCEGHLDHGRPAPWVEIEAPTSKNLRGNAKEAYLLRHRKRLLWRMLHLLSAFYRKRFVPADVLLYCRPIGYAGFWLTNQGSEALDILSKRERARKHRRYQREMRAFTEFLTRRKRG